MSQIFFELGRGMDCGPSIELAQSYRSADISARARPRDRATRGFENPTSRSPRNSAFPEPSGLVTTMFPAYWAMCTNPAAGCYLTFVSR